MDTTTELRYLDLIEAFSAEELSRLPLAIQKFRMNLPQLLAESESSVSIEIDLKRFMELFGGLKELIAEQGNAKVRYDALRHRVKFARSELSRKRTGRRLAIQAESVEELKGLSTAAYQELLNEYLFLSRSIDLSELLQLQKLIGTRSAMADAFAERFDQFPAQEAVAFQLGIYEAGIQQTSTALRARLNDSMRSLDWIYGAIEVAVAPAKLEGSTL